MQVHMYVLPWSHYFSLLSPQNLLPTTTISLCWTDRLQPHFGFKDVHSKSDLTHWAQHWKQCKCPHMDNRILLCSLICCFCVALHAQTAQSVSDLSKAAAAFVHKALCHQSCKKPFQLKIKKREYIKERIVHFQHKCCPSKESLRSKGRHFIKSELKPKKLRAAINILQCLATESLSDELSKPLPCINL